MLAFVSNIGGPVHSINYICLVYMQIHALFYFNYIIYSGLLIFCCQNVAKLFEYSGFRVLVVRRLPHKNIHSFILIKHEHFPLVCW